MSSVLRPAGPLPPRVYWIRRLLAIAVVVVLVLILSWAWGALTGGDGSASPGLSTSTGSQGSSPSSSGTSSTPSSSSSVSHSASHSKPTKSASSSATTSSATSSSTSTAAQPCPAGAIVVSVSTDAKSYPANVQPRLSMSVRNSSKVSCTRDVGQAALELRVSTPAGLVVWSSDHCAPGGPHDVVTLKPNQVFRTALVWLGRTTSKQGCPTGQPKAGSGSYVLTGRDLSAASVGARFDLL